MTFVRGAPCAAMSDWPARPFFRRPGRGRGGHSARPRARQAGSDKVLGAVGEAVPSDAPPRAGSLTVE